MVDASLRDGGFSTAIKAWSENVRDDYGPASRPPVRENFDAKSCHVVCQGATRAPLRMAKRAWSVVRAFRPFHPPEWLKSFPTGARPSVMKNRTFRACKPPPF